MIRNADEILDGEGNTMKTQYKPKVSIVIPAYNASNYLKEAIESALGQTYPNVEVIVINDGSCDNGATAKVAKEYEGRICYLEKENGGSSSALNMGICNMSGEWFSWLSHDDLYKPDKVEKQIAYLNKLDIPPNDCPKHIFFSAADFIDANGKILRRSDSKKSQSIAIAIEKMESNEYMVAQPTQYSFHGCSCLIHRKAFETVGMFNEELRLLNDVDLWYRLYTSDFKVHYIPEALVLGRVHSKQISRSIGYSYHNPEQDMFWERSFRWLMENHADNLKLMYLFGKNAYKKTRDVDGDRAFEMLYQRYPEYRLILSVKKKFYQLNAAIRNMGKCLILTIKA